MSGYEILSLDELPRVPYRGGGQTLRPLRKTLDFKPFGVNVWSADTAGDGLIPPHEEDSGNEELYVVVRGRARFTVGEETFDAPGGTLVFVVAGELRTASAAEAGTMILAAGATVGKAFTPGGWEDFHLAFAQLEAGDPAAGRATMAELVARDDQPWAGHYNFACYLALAGEIDDAFDELRKALELNRGEAMKWLPEDSDLDPLRHDPRFRELAR